MSDDKPSIGNMRAIEETLAHQDQQISDLSEMIIAQNEEIAALRKQIAKMGGKIESLEDDLSGAPAADEKPPHY